MAPGSMAGPTGTGVRALEQPSGIGASFTNTGTGTGAPADEVVCVEAADAWVGMTIEFDSTVADSENRKHQAFVVKRVTTAITIWPPCPASLTSGDTFQIRTNPVPWAVEDGGVDNSKIEIHDSTKTGWADDEPNGYYALCIYAAGSIDEGECKQITDHDLGTTISTVGAFSANITDGDFFLILKPIAPDGDSLAFDTPQTMIARDTVRDSSAPDKDFPAERRPSVSFQIPLKSTGDPVGNGEDWDEKAKGASQLLLQQLMGTATQDGGSVDEGTGDTSTLHVTDGTGGEFSEGNAALVNGEMIVIGSIDESGDPDILDCGDGGGPALSAAPTAAAPVYGSFMARLATDGSQYPSTFLYFEDNLLKIAWCCTGNATIQASPNQRLMLALAYTECQYWGVQETTMLADLDDTHYPELDVSDVRVANGRASWDGTEIELTDVAMDMGIDVQPRPDVNAVEGNRGGFMLPGRSTATLTGLPMEDAGNYQNVDQAATAQLLLQFNRVPGNVVGIVFTRGQINAAPVEVGSIIRYNLTVLATRPDEDDPLGDAMRIYFA